MVAVDMEQYLKASEVIDWHHPDIVELAYQLASGCESSGAMAVSEAPPLEAGRSKTIAKQSFEWVRDQIRHSSDYQMNPVTCRASEVLKHKTGYCFAKSHLLAALLRANHIPAGFCYQRLSIDDQGAPYSLHGFNAIYLPETGWYRVDARGNKPGVDAQFTPPQEQLAYRLQFAEEVDFPAILAEPLPIVVSALRSRSTWDDMLRYLPDLSLESAKRFGLRKKYPPNW